MSKTKKIATTLKTILENDTMKNIMDRAKDISSTIDEVINYWQFDMFSKKPGVGFLDDGTKTTSLDLASLLFTLSERGAVINIPSYTSSRATKLKEGQALTSKENRHGQVIGLIANKETFSFSLRICDANVITSERIGDFRNYSITDLDGNFWEGWGDLQFIESVPENKFIIENKLNDGDKINFENFISPNRWISFYGQYYFMTKALINRLSEESKYYFSEVKKMLDEGITYPPSESPVEWPASEKIPGKKIKVQSFEVAIDVPDNNSEYPKYEHNQEMLVELSNRRRLLTYTMIPKLTFATRTVELAYFKFGKDNNGNDKLPVWIENVKWQKDYVQPGKRTKWDRMILFQDKVGEVGVSIRKRVYETTQEVSESYYAVRAGKTRNEIAVILDESGSMLTIKEPIIDLFNQQVDAIKENSNDIESHVSLVTFSTSVRSPILWRKANDDLRKIDYLSYKPQGLTALWDAIGLTVEKYQKEELGDNTNYLFVILTDGDENNSKKYRDQQSIGNLIESLQETGKWTFTYIGANQNLEEIQKTLRIKKGNITDFDATAAGVKKAAFTVTRGINSYYGATKDGKTNVSNFYDSDKDKDAS